MFTREELIAAAVKAYGGPVCADFIDDAMQEETLEDAVEVIVIDSAYWDGTY